MMIKSRKFGNRRQRKTPYTCVTRYRQCKATCYCSVERLLPCANCQNARSIAAGHIDELLAAVYPVDAENTSNNLRIDELRARRGADDDPSGYRQVNSLGAERRKMVVNGSMRPQNELAMAESVAFDTAEICRIF